MKNLFTIVSAVIISVAVSLLIQRYQFKSDLGGSIVGSPNVAKCGLDERGHIVPDDKGGCVPPSPTGDAIGDVIPARKFPLFSGPEGLVAAKYPVSRGISSGEMEVACPWETPVSEACQRLFRLPSSVSCIGKPFKTCMVNEAR